MEDGGGYTLNDISSKQQFASYFGGEHGSALTKEDMGNILKKYKTLRMSIGHIGIRITKIMTHLTGYKSNYYDYATNYLYHKNEINIKYYPVCFQTANGGDQKVLKTIETYIGLNLGEYREVCEMVRPAILAAKMHLLSPDKFYIACCGPWREVLRGIFPDISYPDTYTYRDGDKDVFRLYFDNAGIARFAYFGLLTRSISDACINVFADMVRQYADPTIINRLSLATP
jgi:hypothetical protein